MSVVDVLIPVYNRASLLPAALDSVLKQTYQDFRVIIYDDGSTESYTIPEDSRIVFIRGEENLGVGHARNVLLDAAEAPLCCWQDSDDISHPKRLEILFKFMHARSWCDMVLSWMWFFKHPGPHTRTRTVYKVDSGKFWRPFGFKHNLTFATGMFRKRLRSYRFNAKKRDGGEDLEWMKLLVKGGRPIRHLNQPLYYCRRHLGRTTFTRQSEAEKARTAESWGLTYERSS